MPTSPDDWVAVYRKSSKEKLPFRLPRKLLRFNPDLRVVPSEKAKERRLDLTDPDPNPGPEQTQTTIPDPEGSSTEKEKH